MKKGKEVSDAAVPPRDVAADDGEPEGKSVTGILLGIVALFLLVVALQVIQRC